MAQAVPFLAERRMVVVRGLLSAIETRSDAARRRPRQQTARGKNQTTTLDSINLPDMLMTLPPTTDITFIDEKLSANNPLLKALQPLSQIHEFPIMRHSVLGHWIRDRMLGKGSNITPRAIEELVSLVGGNLWAMDTELEKLATYCGDQIADVQDVRDLASPAKQSTVFNLVDAIMARQTSVALSLMEQLLFAGNSGPALLSLIARQARLVVLAQELTALKVPQSNWGKHLGITQDFVIRKTNEQAHRFSSAQVRNLYQLLVEADLSMKTGSLTDELALVELIGKLATPV